MLLKIHEWLCVINLLNRRDQKKIHVLYVYYLKLHICHIGMYIIHAVHLMEAKSTVGTGQTTNNPTT